MALARMDNQEYGYLIPATAEERSRLRAMIADFIDGSDWVPPVTLRQLDDLSAQFINGAGLHPGLSGWLMVELNNRIWRDVFSAVPCERRILLLPQCLKNVSACTAEVDELGLLCRRCGKCSIASMEEMAEQQGMMSLVAEGITVVSKLAGLFESGEIDAVIGVGCLESLEKTFPVLVENAVPGMAVALNCAGCKDTNMDEDYLKTLAGRENHTRLRGNDDTTTFRGHHYEQLKADINHWFAADNTIHLSGNTSDCTSRIAREWLCGEGKRWRPLLLVAVYQAITDKADIPEQVKQAAIAVEMFHKASLVHDDIQDNDLFRYGKPTVYSVYGVPMAINVGDKLIGDGYRLLAECGRIELVKEAAIAHAALCRGQGLELEWRRNPLPLSMQEVINMIENKTVPAFAVALSFAVVCADGDEKLKSILEKYAYSLGIAYQLMDDLSDFHSDTDICLNPSSVLAALCEASDNNIEKASARVTGMAESYKQQSLDSLIPLKNTALKQLLFRITKKILHNL